MFLTSELYRVITCYMLIKRYNSKMVIIAAVIFSIISTSAIAQDAGELDQCSQQLAKTESALSRLQQADVHGLLSSVNSTCLTSVEYSEWVNELIYAVVTTRPSYFIKSFTEQPQDIQKNILSELESPMHDGIDLKKAFEAVSTLPESAERKNTRSAIRIAGSKVGLSF